MMSGSHTAEDATSVTKMPSYVLPSKLDAHFPRQKTSV